MVLVAETRWSLPPIWLIEIEEVCANSIHKLAPNRKKRVAVERKDLYCNCDAIRTNHVPLPAKPGTLNMACRGPWQ